MLRILLLSWLTVGLTGCGTTKKSRDEARIHMQMGTTFLTQANYPAAMRELLDAERLDPNNAAIQNNLGITFFMRERLVDAEKHLRRALEIDPKFTDAKTNLGRVLIDAGKLDIAIKLLEEATQDLTYENAEKAYLNLGIALFKKGQYESAKKNFESALKVNRTNCMTQSYFGRTLFELKNFIESSRVLDQAIVLCKPMGFDEPHFYSGMSYLKLGVLGKAVARFEEVIKLYPNGKYTSNARSMIDGIH